MNPNLTVALATLLLTAGCIGVSSSLEEAGQASGDPSQMSSSEASTVSRQADLSSLNRTTGEWNLTWTQYGAGPVHEVSMPGRNCIFIHTSEDFEIVRGYVAVDWDGALAATNPEHIILRVGGGDGFFDRWVEHRVWQGNRSQNYTIEVDGWAPEWEEAPPDMLVGFYRPDYVAYAGVEHSGAIRINFHHTGEVTTVETGTCA